MSASEIQVAILARRYGLPPALAAVVARLVFGEVRSDG